jgi:hypothetical protein
LAWGRKEEKTECDENGINKARTVDGAAGLDPADSKVSRRRAAAALPADAGEDTVHHDSSQGSGINPSALIGCWICAA